MKCNGGLLHKSDTPKLILVKANLSGAIIIPMFAGREQISKK